MAFCANSIGYEWHSCLEPLKNECDLEYDVTQGIGWGSCPWSVSPYLHRHPLIDRYGYVNHVMARRPPCLHHLVGDTVPRNGLGNPDGYDEEHYWRIYLELLQEATKAILSKERTQFSATGRLSGRPGPRFYEIRVRAAGRRLAHPSHACGRCFGWHKCC